MSIVATTTTRRLRRRRSWIPIHIGIGLMTIAMAGCFLSGVLVGIMGKERIAPSTVILIHTATPSLVPLPRITSLTDREHAAWGSQRLAWSMVCFAEPDGAALGPIDAGRPFTRWPDAAETDRWVRIRVSGVQGYDGNGACWVRRIEIERRTHHLDASASP